MNDRHGGRRPSFMGLWLGRLIGVLCFGYAALILTHTVPVPHTAPHTVHQTHHTTRHR